MPLAEMTDLFEYIKGIASWAEEESTEKYIAALVDATNQYCESVNSESVFHSETIEFYDIQADYFKWSSNQ